MSKKRILILGSLILILSISFLVFWIIEQRKESIQEAPLEFTEEDCRLLLLEKDPSISEMDFKEQQFNYHVDFSESQKPVNWKINNSEESFQDTPPQKIVFFVSSDIFEGCGIMQQMVATETPVAYEYFKCEGDREIWLNIHKEPEYVFVHSIMKSPQIEGESIYYYSNINQYGEGILEDNYEEIKNECQKL
jgi:hypothetical protein